MGQDALSGIVDRDLERCVGWCWMCAMACPYGVIGRQSGARKAVSAIAALVWRCWPSVGACPTGTLVFADEAEFSGILRREAAQKMVSGKRGTA
jgi:anaerobic carbon-monoxide dehydrogenase iron sulfur subunit